MRFALYPNAKRDLEYQHTRRLIDAIEAHGGESYLSPHLAEDFNYKNLQRRDIKEADFVISLGGDGTFLSSLALPGLENVPRVGVNLGSIGFLQEILPQEIEKRVANLFRGQYQIQKRAMFHADCYDLDNNLYASGEALNDVILTRGITSSILRIKLFINGAMVETVPGDGLIVATPTGSTAYTLSCGGPIVHPELDMMVITPICPHSLHNRSYIADKESIVRMELVAGATPATVSIDGRCWIAMELGGYVDVCRSSKSLHYIQFEDDNFYETLAKKIQQRGISQ